MNDFKLIPGRAYRLKVDFRATPYDIEAAIMETNAPLPAGTVIMTWPYRRDPEVDLNIASAGQVSGPRYDLAVLGVLPEGCCRFYRVLAEHLEGVASEIVS